MLSYIDTIHAVETKALASYKRLSWVRPLTDGVPGPVPGPSRLLLAKVIFSTACHLPHTLRPPRRMSEEVPEPSMPRTKLLLGLYPAALTRNYIRQYLISLL